eukprot:GILK01008254.1.p1 GENE.GILK01008254.1~~GILK01008254.1.p1  ORF type:complete len:266 (+),score=64.87 GILK01008254.1:128-925(+)
MSSALSISSSSWLSESSSSSSSCSVLHSALPSPVCNELADTDMTSVTTTTTTVYEMDSTVSAMSTVSTASTVSCEVETGDELALSVDIKEQYRLLAFIEMSNRKSKSKASPIKHEPTTSSTKTSSSSPPAMAKRNRVKLEPAANDLTDAMVTDVNGPPQDVIMVDSCAEEAAVPDVDIKEQQWILHCIEMDRRKRQKLEAQKQQQQTSTPPVRNGRGTGKRSSSQKRRPQRSVSAAVTGACSQLESPTGSPVEPRQLVHRSHTSS